MIKHTNLPRYGDVIDVRINGQKGARYYNNGEFLMFLEP
jgi:hypothetical protein